MKTNPEMHHLPGKIVLHVVVRSADRRSCRHLPRAPIYQLQDLEKSKLPVANVPESSGKGRWSVLALGRGRGEENDPFIKRLARLQ